MTTERKRILDQLGAYQYLTTGHFYQLWGAGSEVSDRAVRRLLKDFCEHGFLRRRMIVLAPSASGIPRYEYVYTLSAAGLSLAKTLGLTGTEILRLRDTTRNLEHEVAITDVHLAVERFGQSHQWALYWLQDRLKRSVNPDAVFGLTDPLRPTAENTAYYFLEVERAREATYIDSRSGLMRRLERYAEYHGTETCRQDWQWFDEFRVIVVVPTESRRRNLLERLSKRLPSPMFWIATEGSEFARKIFKSPFDYEVREWSFLD